MNEKEIVLRIAGQAYKPTIAVDFDGTISQEVGYPDMGEPFYGTREVLEQLQRDYFIRIYTCRMNGVNASNWHDAMSSIKSYLDLHQIPYDDIVPWNEGKPYADYYIDNRAVRFDGNWFDVLDFIKNDFHPKL